MDPRLLQYYNRELQFVREMGAEFAQAYPKIAARLGLEGLECADPYVERLVESFAFLAARVQLKLDARHPAFTEHLLNIVYPDFLAPLPSALVAQFVPDVRAGSLKEGLRIPRGSSLKTPLAKGERTACEFTTAHDVTLWPLTVADARYLSGSGALAQQGLPAYAQAKAAIRLSLKAAPGLTLAALPIDTLDFHLKGTPDVVARLFEQLHADVIGVVLRASRTGAVTCLSTDTVCELGFEDDEALLPVTHRGFSGYRLIQEYFLLPERFQFLRLRALAAAWGALAAETCEIFILLDRADSALENALDAATFRLHCTPACNLFTRSCDRLHVDGTETEYHIIPDRNRPQDFEVHRVQSVAGVAGAREDSFEIHPFYATTHRTANEPRAFYTVQRSPRLYSNRQAHTGERTSYIGSECYISIVDAAERPLTGAMRYLDIQALCTNRDLPLQMVFSQGRTDFLLDGGAPLESIRCITGPTRPRASPAFGETAWRLISHLSLNYLSLQAGDAGLLRDFLALYADAHDSVCARQIEGVRSISYEPVVRRIPAAGPVSHGRGLQVNLTLDDGAFEGQGIVLLGAVLERFFARYVSLNSFTQLRLLSATRGEIKQWPVRLGVRQSL